MGKGRSDLWLGWCLLALGLLLGVSALASSDGDGGHVHWAAIVTSIGAIVAAVGVFFVWMSVREAERTRAEAEKTRHATTAADISRRWDEAEMRSSRELIRQQVRGGTLTDAFFAGAKQSASDDELETFMILQVVPNYLEDVVILLSLGALDSEFVEKSLGTIIRGQWLTWRDAANVYANEVLNDPWPNLRRHCGESAWKPPAD